MKKIAILLLVIVFSQCQVKIEPKTANAQQYSSYFIAEPGRGTNGASSINVTVYKKDGIEYRIFTNDAYDGKSIFVINHTKEKLEVELLRKQFPKFKK